MLHYLPVIYARVCYTYFLWVAARRRHNFWAEFVCALAPLVWAKRKFHRICTHAPIERGKLTPAQNIAIVESVLYAVHPFPSLSIKMKQKIFLSMRNKCALPEISSLYIPYGCAHLCFFIWYSIGFFLSGVWGWEKLHKGIWRRVIKTQLIEERKTETFGAVRIRKSRKIKDESLRHNFGEPRNPERGVFYVRLYTRASYYIFSMNENGKDVKENVFIFFFRRAGFNCLLVRATS